MKKRSLLIAAACIFGLCARQLAAQDKPKSPETNPDEIRFSLSSLKVQVVFSEYEGEKKLKSLPYSFLVTTHTRESWPEAKIRVGSRVPVYVGSSTTSGSMTYMDVGTNIDCRAEAVKQGEFRIILNLERSWVEGDVMVPVEKAPTTQSGGGESHASQFREPIIRQYRAELSPLLKEGQSFETSLATDPLSGRVMKVEVSISVLK